VQFHRRAPGADRMPWWEQAFIVSLAAICLAWGAGGWWIMPHGSLVHQALVYFFLMGIAGGAVATYAAHATASAMAICALMLPATVGFALENVLELRVMALGGLLYLFAALRSTRSFAYFLHQTFQLSHALHQAYERAREMARTDELTGLANRRAFLEQGTAALDQALRYGRPLSLVMCDIDHFKPINDTHGHAAGDAVLRAVAERLRRAARAADIPGRIGGEEFALLLPETGRDGAVAVAEKLCRAVEAFAYRSEAFPDRDAALFRLTVSAGVACASLAPNSMKRSKVSFSVRAVSAPRRSTLLITTMARWPNSSAFFSTKRVWGSGPSEASTSSSTPSTILRVRSTSPPKSAWPGVSTMLIFTPR